MTMRIPIILLATLFLGLPEANLIHSVSANDAEVRKAELLRTSNASAPKSTPQALPEPTGAYSVCTSVFHLTDTSRADTLSNSPGQFRELMFQVWYPTDIVPKGKPAPYIPNPALLRALKDEKHDSQESSVLDGWKDVQTHAILDAPLSRKPARFPLLFFSHGLGEPRSLYTGR